MYLETVETYYYCPFKKKNMHAVKQTSERTYRWHKHHLLSAVWQFLQL